MDNPEQRDPEDQQQAILNHLRYLAKQIQALEEAQKKMLREMGRTRRSVATVWLAELISPILALALVGVLGYYGIKFAEQQYLGGMDVFGKIHETLKEAGSKLSQSQQDLNHQSQE